jgi:site-specific DNA-methyltransferase (cytosine-N4-specific)
MQGLTFTTHTSQPSLWEPLLSTAARPDRKSTGTALSARVEQGDAFDLISGLPNHSVDLILTSPPYWGLRTYDGEHNWEITQAWERSGATPESAPSYEWYVANGGVLGLEPYPEWYVAHLVEFFEMARRCLKPSGSIWLNIGDTYFARWSSIRDRGRQGLGEHPRERRRVPMGGYRQEKQLLLIPARVAIGMQEQRWILRNDLIWHKPNVPPRPERDRLRLAHEHFFHFVHRPTSGRAKYYYDLSKAEYRANDVATVNVKAGQDEHTATFPEDLIVPRILSSCPPGGLVLDPFSGSGRTLTAAIKHGRSAIGFEISSKFAKSANDALTANSRL